MLPGGHPHAPRRRRFPRLRRRAPLSHRHYDALTARIDRLDHERKEDVERLFTRIGYIEDTLAAIRDQPDAVMLARIADRLDQLEQTARDHYERRDRLIVEFLENFTDSANTAAGAARRVRDELA